jgi:tripartite-type tricarboxylate transporter receptor subunit TctC
MSGPVELMVAPVAAVIAAIRSTQLRPLGVTTAKRIDIGEFVGLGVVAVKSIAIDHLDMRETDAWHRK